MYRIIGIGITLGCLLLTGCGATSQDGGNGYNEPEPCLFSNPIADGADPWIIKHDDTYYSIESSGGGIHVSETDNLIGLGENEQQVWTQPSTGWNRSNLWAPELHHINGKWYIFYTAGDTDGSPFLKQRSGVLEAKTDNPQGEYEDKGMLYTGDNIEDQSNNKWAIDMTPLEHNGQLYAIWSGWEENEDTDRTPQHLYIAKMENPWTISSNRVQISSPDEDWEKSTELAINEGPEVLKNDGQTFVIYSASESWLPAYKLGQLKLVGDDPMDPNNWEKSGPVFQGTEEVHGVGHASFTTSPDGTEDWIAYHTKVSTEPGWDRVIHFQAFEWNEDGSPDFGTPVPSGETMSKPSGTCD